MGLIGSIDGHDLGELIIFQAATLEDTLDFKKEWKFEATRKSLRRYAEIQQTSHDDKFPGFHKLDADLRYQAPHKTLIRIPGKSFS